MVTGVEAAGLVLATIPLLLATLEIYAKGISVTKRYLRYSKPFNGLLEDLRAEQTIYDNTIQILLIGVVSQNDMSEFLANPGSDRWKLPKFEEKLKARLGRSYSSYMDTITRMDSTTVDFKHRLKFDKSEPVRNSFQKTTFFRVAAVSKCLAVSIWDSVCFFLTSFQKHDID